jgi:hypothetical protein
VDGRFLVDGDDAPGLIERLATLEPLQGAAALEGLPFGAQGEIDLAVAVDVVGVDADVVRLGAARDDGAQLPVGVLEPDDALAIDELQPAGGRRMSAADFTRGRRLPPGTRLR